MDWHAPGLIAPSTRTPPPRFVTDVIVELGLAAPDDVHAAVEAAKTSGGRAEAVLLRTGALDEERLAHALAERYGLDRLDLEQFPVDPEAARLVGLKTALRHEALPVARMGDRTLLVAVADPAGGPAASAIAAATGHEVVPAVAPRGRLRGLIEAAASRSAVAPPPPATPVAPAAPGAPEGEPHHDRLLAPHHEGTLPVPHDDGAGHLERELAEAHAHLAAAHQRAEESEQRAAGAEERLGAAMQRILELEGELAGAHARLVAVRAALDAA